MAVLELVDVTVWNLSPRHKAHQREGRLLNSHDDIWIEGLLDSGDFQVGRQPDLVASLLHGRLRTKIYSLHLVPHSSLITTAAVQMIVAGYWNTIKGPLFMIVSDKYAVHEHIND